MSLYRFSAAAALLLLAAGAQAADTLYRVQSLGRADEFSSTAFGINEQGWVVGRRSLRDGLSAFFYRDGQFVDLGRLNGRRPHQALGINDAGQIVGEAGNHGFLYDGGTMTDLSAWQGLGATYAGVGHDINQRGQATGVVSDGRNSFAFISDGVTGQRIAVPNSTITIGLGINERGQVAGTTQFVDEPRGRAFVFDGTQTQLLPLLADGSKPVVANDINNAGWMAVDVLGTDGSFRPYLYGDGQYTQLAGAGGMVSAINNQGWTVGSAGFHALLYRDGQSLDLNTLLRPADAQRWSALNVAFDINDRGQIVGHGYLANGRLAAFVATPVPEAGSWALMLGGLALVAGVARRRAAAPASSVEPRA